MNIRTIEYKSMEKVIKEFDKSFDKKYIFRGQTNDYTDKTNEWKLSSSFRRYFSGNEISFNSFIVNNLNRGLFNSYFSDYKYENSKQISNAPFVEKLYFMQHYGIPTCLMDFTKNPIIALYFALSGIKLNRIQTYTNAENTTFPKDQYVTVYQVDTKLLKDIFKIKEIVDKDFCWDYDQFEVPFNTQNHIKMAIDLNPLKKMDSSSKLYNYNLKNQEGCFILYDNTEAYEDISLIETLEHICNNHIKKEISTPIIIKHNFYLNELMNEMEDRNIFSFVRNTKKMTGKYLFNDIQGLKFDLLQIHDD